MSVSLEFSDGSDLEPIRLPVPPGGVLIGREPRSCDICIDSPTLSSIQARVTRRGDATELVNYGLNPVLVRGSTGGVEQPRGEPIRLADGDDFAFRDGQGGDSLIVFRVIHDPQGANPNRRWAIRLDGGARSVGLLPSPMRIGGASDHLTIPGWPSGLVTLWQHGEFLSVSLKPPLRGPPLLVDKKPLRHADVRRCHPEMTIGFGAHSIQLEARGDDGGVTAAALAPHPDALGLEVTPGGWGRLRLCYPDGRWGGAGPEKLTIRLGPQVTRVLEVLVWQHHRSRRDPAWSDLVAALAWPDVGQGARRDRTDVNTALLRIREKLLGEGIDAVQLLRKRKARSGNATGTLLHVGDGQVAPTPTDRVERAFRSLKKDVRGWLSRNRGRDVAWLCHKTELGPDTLEALLGELATEGRAAVDPASGLWRAVGP